MVVVTCFAEVVDGEVSGAPISLIYLSASPSSDILRSLSGQSTFSMPPIEDRPG